jgi:hypothetical protein
LKQWQERWIHPSLYGGAQGREAIEAAFDFALDAEEAQNASQTWIASLLDYQKYFDHIHWEILWPAAQHWGLPLGIFRACSNFYCQLSSRFKFGGHFGPTFTRTKSIAQGCPLAVLWANICGTLWARTIDREAPNCRFGVFVDDKTLRARTRADWITGMKSTLRFDLSAGHIPNPTKIQVIAALSKDRKWVAKQTFHGAPPQSRPCCHLSWCPH